MSLSPPMIWSRLRATRSAPPGQATASAGRRRTYAAAMTQFEELTHAATVVSAASRPLPLYYALNQAGRAIAAAHAQPQSWQLSGHGLKLKDAGRPLVTRRVAPEGKDGTAFRGVAVATGSAPLDEPVTVGALCASLPEIATIDALCADNPRALPVQTRAKSAGPVIVMSRNVYANVANLPDDLLTAPDLHESLSEVLADYPTADGWDVPEQPRPHHLDDTWRSRCTLRWHVPESVSQPNEPDRQARMCEVAPEYLTRNNQWCRPAVAGSAVLSPLMTWWAVLYALSMVARYEPDNWVGLLDVDKSDLAVPLEDLLVDAMGALPHLVLDAITGDPLLLRPSD